MYKWTIFFLGVAATIALPVAYLLTIVGSGPASVYLLVLFAPSGLQMLSFAPLVLAPLLLPIFNFFYPPKGVPRIAIVLQAVFFTLWACLSCLVLLANTLTANLGVEGYGLLRQIVFVLVVTSVCTCVAHALVVSRRRGKGKGGFFIPKSIKVLSVIIGALTIIVIGIFVGINEHFKGRFQKVESEMKALEDKYILPAGGYRWDDPHYSPTGQTRGNGLLGMRKCNATVSCPQISVSWKVPIEPGRELEFMREVMKGSGFSFSGDERSEACSTDYYNRCFTDGVKGTLYMAMHVDSEQLTTPKDSIWPKIWHNVNIKITPTWGN